MVEKAAQYGFLLMRAGLQYCKLVVRLTEDVANDADRQRTRQWLVGASGFSPCGQSLKPLDMVGKRKAASKERCGIGGFTLSSFCLDLNVVAPTRVGAWREQPFEFVANIKDVFPTSSCTYQSTGL